MSSAREIRRQATQETIAFLDEQAATARRHSVCAQHTQRQQVKFAAIHNAFNTAANAVRNQQQMHDDAAAAKLSRNAALDTH